MSADICHMYMDTVSTYPCATHLSSTSGPASTLAARVDMHRDTSIDMLNKQGNKSDGDAHLRCNRGASKRCHLCQHAYGLVH